MPEFPLTQWLLGLVCAFLVGVAKTGVPGLGILVVPLMVLAVGDARMSAGALLPILCVGDVFAVIYWHRHAAAGRLFSLVPWVLVGMGMGAGALSLNERTLRWMVGAIVVAMLVVYLRRRMLRGEPAVSHGAPYGVTAGFATTVANAAGPVMNLYLLSKQLPKEEFMGTGAWFFFAINLSKIPIYTWHGLISRHSLIFDACLVPAAVLGAMTGRRLVHHIPQKLFEALVVILTAVSTAFLFK